MDSRYCHINRVVRMRIIWKHIIKKAIAEDG